MQRVCQCDMMAKIHIEKHVGTKEVDTLTNEMDNHDIELGDIISLDDENGEELGDFEVIAKFDMNGKTYVALTSAIDEEADAEEDLEEEIDIFLFSVEGGEMVPLEEEEEAAAYAKLNEILEDVELIDEEK